MILFFIGRIEGAAGEMIFVQEHKVACLQCIESELLEDEEVGLGIELAGPLKVEVSSEGEIEMGLELELPVEEESVEAPPLQTQAEQVLEPRTAYIIRSMLQDVVKRGTARRALKLGRTDLAGKTGTTNDQIDAWFSGFNDDVVASVWVGYDSLKTMGRRETGSSAALPIWVDFMEEALKGSEMSQRTLPDGMQSVRIDPASGLLAHPDQLNAVFEIFREENAPTEMAVPESEVVQEGSDGSEVAVEVEELF